MKWKLRWTLYASGETVRMNMRGLRSLQKCRNELSNILRQARLDGFVLLDAHAMPELACGTVRLFGTAPAPMGVARCGAL